MKTAKQIASIILALLLIAQLPLALAEYTDQETIKAVQQALKDKGYYRGDVSGIKGNATESAIRNYQQRNHMKENGQIDDALLEALKISTSIAEQTTEQVDPNSRELSSGEIRFQGIPWYSSPDEVTKLLGESGFTSGKAFKLRELRDKESLSLSHIAKYSKDTKVPYMYSIWITDEQLSTKLLRQWQNNVEKTIAKHEVYYLDAFYTAEPGNPRLVEISMTLRTPDGSYDQKAIYNTLEKAFGKPKASRKGYEYIWLGENNTIAILNRNQVVFATLDGLEFAETVDLGFEEPEDTGF